MREHAPYGAAAARPRRLLPWARPRGFGARGPRRVRGFRPLAPAAFPPTWGVAHHLGHVPGQTHEGNKKKRQRAPRTRQLAQDRPQSPVVARQIGRYPQGKPSPQPRAPPAGHKQSQPGGIAPIAQRVPPEPQPSQPIAIGVVIASLLALVPLFADGYGLSLGISMLSYAVLATAWAMFSGPTRYISLATVAFFGIGAYMVAVLGELLPWPLVLLVAGFLAPVPILMLHIVEALVQAYIFGMLALVYIAGGIQAQELKQHKDPEEQS